MHNYKIYGEKNPLTAEEKKYFLDKLNNRYTLGEQLGVSGVNTSTYKIFDKKNNPFVLRIPNDFNNQFWVEQQISIEKIRTHYLLGYDETIALPEILELGQRYTIEPYLGEPLTKKMYYFNLSNQEKNNIANQIGTFLNFLHQQKQKNNKGNIEILSSHPLYSIHDIFNYFTPHLSPKENKTWEKRINLFLTRDTSDEVETLTHGNIQTQNILYNTKNKKVAIVDWDTLKNRAQYHDFIPLSTFNLPYHLLKGITTTYNNAEKDTDIKINLQKLLLFHLLTTYYNFGCKALHDKEQKMKPTNQIPTLLHQYITPIEQKIKTLYGKEIC